VPRDRSVARIERNGGISAHCRGAGQISRKLRFRDANDVDYGSAAQLKIAIQAKASGLEFRQLASAEQQRLESSLP